MAMIFTSLVKQNVKHFLHPYAFTPPKWYYPTPFSHAFHTTTFIKKQHCKSPTPFKGQPNKSPKEKQWSKKPPSPPRRSTKKKVGTHIAIVWDQENQPIPSSFDNNFKLEVIEERIKACLKANEIEIPQKLVIHVFGSIDQVRKCFRSQIKQLPFRFHPTKTVKKGDQKADEAIESFMDSWSLAERHFKLQYDPDLKTYIFLIAGDGGYVKKLLVLQEFHKILVAFRPIHGSEDLAKVADILWDFDKLLLGEDLKGSAKSEGGVGKENGKEGGVGKENGKEGGVGKAEEEDGKEGGVGKAED